MYPQALAEKLRAQGHDVVAVSEDPDLVGSDDESVLAYANTAQRCLITENVQDFAALANTPRTTESCSPTHGVGRGAASGSPGWR
jgi:predicted nuclease of predicted toxin-antitoxin system